MATEVMTTRTFELDYDIRAVYMKLQEWRKLRMWMQFTWHPESLNRTKGPQKVGEPFALRRQALDGMGFGETFYQRCVAEEEAAKTLLETLAKEHPLWEHLRQVKGFGPYLAGGFIAAGGDIRRANTITGFWKGMGLDVLPDGTVPRRVRGRKEVERKIPCPPHVSLAGEQVRHQMLYSKGTLRAMYDSFRAQVDARHPDRAKIINMKDAQRRTQKILYAALWRVWREAYGLPAPMPYAFDILMHDARPVAEGGSYYTIADFYDRD